MRRIVLPSGQSAILSDTVGFIANIPTDLISAFRATLEEVVAASEKKIENVIEEEGRQAVKEVGIDKMHPELVKLIGKLKYRTSFGQSMINHCKEVAFLAGAMAAELRLDEKMARRCALLHDIGKVTTRRFLPGGKVTFHGHAEEGVRMFRRGPAKRIEFPRDEYVAIEELIRFHLRPGQYEPSWTDSAVRRFHRETEPFLRDLLDLGRADITSKRPGKRAACLRSIHALSERIDALAAEDAKPKPLPAGLGNLLMTGLDLPPGKHLGDLRKRLEALFAEGALLGGQPPEYYLEVVRERDLMNGIEIQPPRGFSRPED